MNMLIAVITIIVGVIKLSLISVYVKIIENISKNTIVVINDIKIPFIILEIDRFFLSVAMCRCKERAKQTTTYNNQQTGCYCNS